MYTAEPDSGLKDIKNNIHQTTTKPLGIERSLSELTK